MLYACCINAVSIMYIFANTINTEALHVYFCRQGTRGAQLEGTSKVPAGANSPTSSTSHASSTATTPPTALTPSFDNQRKKRRMMTIQSVAAQFADKGELRSAEDGVALAIKDEAIMFKSLCNTVLSQIGKFRCNGLYLVPFK